MELLDVNSSKTVLSIGELFTISFKIEGALPAGFTFPFSNESKTVPLLEFIKKEE